MTAEGNLEFVKSTTWISFGWRRGAVDVDLIKQSVLANKHLKHRRTSVFV